MSRRRRWSISRFLEERRSRDETAARKVVHDRAAAYYSFLPGRWLLLTTTALSDQHQKYRKVFSSNAVSHITCFFFFLFFTLAVVVPFEFGDGGKVYFLYALLCNHQYGRMPDMLTLRYVSPPIYSGNGAEQSRRTAFTNRVGLPEWDQWPRLRGRVVGRTRCLSRSTATCKQ